MNKMDKVTTINHNELDLWHTSINGIDMSADDRITLRKHQWMSTPMDDGSVCFHRVNGYVYAIRMDGLWRLHRLGGLPATSIGNLVGFFEYGVPKMIGDLDIDDIDKVVLALKYSLVPHSQHRRSFYCYQR